jgi:hypothetical protein
MEILCYMDSYTPRRRIEARNKRKRQVFGKKMPFWGEAAGRVRIHVAQNFHVVTIDIKDAPY